MKKLRGLLAILFAFVMVLSVTPVSSAHADRTTECIHNHYSCLDNSDSLVRIPHIYRKCPNCKKSNMNYGYDQWFSGGTDSFSSGAFCPMCNSTVPSGERHVCTYWEDKYFFVCSSCGTFYTDLVGPIYTDHYVVNV